MDNGIMTTLKSKGQWYYNHSKIAKGQISSKEPKENDIESLV
jgi:hypothetical protein